MGNADVLLMPGGVLCVVWLAESCQVGNVAVTLRDQPWIQVANHRGWRQYGSNLSYKRAQVATISTIAWPSYRVAARA